MAAGGLGGAREAHPGEAVAREVLRRPLRQDLVLGVLQLTDPSRLHLRVKTIELREHSGDPRAPLLGDDEPQVGEPLEHATQDQLPQRPVGEEGGLHQPHHPGRGVRAVIR